jgi:hypothetical protein
MFGRKKKWKRKPHSCFMQNESFALILLPPEKKEKLVTKTASYTCIIWI